MLAWRERKPGEVAQNVGETSHHINDVCEHHVVTLALAGRFFKLLP